MDLGLLLCGELEGRGVPVVVARAEGGGGAAADGEVATEQEPEADVDRHDVENILKVIALYGDTAGPNGWVVADLIVEFARAVFLPQPAKNAAKRCGGQRFMTRRPCAGADGVVGFLDVRGAELARFEVAARGDEFAGRAADRALVAPWEFGEK